MAETGASSEDIAHDDLCPVSASGIGYCSELTPFRFVSYCSSPP
jgi:hypothetical protein